MYSQTCTHENMEEEIKRTRSDLSLLWGVEAVAKKKVYGIYCSLYRVMVIFVYTIPNATSVCNFIPPYLFAYYFSVCLSVCDSVCVCVHACCCCLLALSI